MQRAQFSVSIRDLERSDQHRQYELSPAWLDEALGESEARSDGSPGSFEVHLRKNGREVLVKGMARARVTMPCARTMEPVPVNLEAEILLLLSPRAPAPAGAPAQRRARRGREDSEATDEQLSAELAARDEYEGDHVELDGFIREHLLLELPLFPVKSDLPFEPAPATDPRPDEAEEETVDPRLAPLAALAKQLQRTREE
ncbi:MAG TPA: DUF177 domain-containing protein [Polyangiaceae bacterium]|jgi:uncharacterized protein|nr:DUF177 domain-containing protein [Polyangiaceae bacterium]